jgi:hypothetical protein
MRVRPFWGVIGALTVLAGVAYAQPEASSPPQASPPPGDALPAPGAAAAMPAPSPDQPPGYTVKLRSLERSVSELKEQVFRTKAKLQLLKETVLGGVIGASRGIIQHRSEMGGSFRLVKAVYALDGVQIFSKADDSGGLSEMKEFDVYNGAIQPGSHTLTVHLVYQGHGYGVFSYLKGFKFNVRGSHTFVAGEGKATVVTVVGHEKGGVTTTMEDKPAIDFRVKILAPEGAGTAAKK